ncbi:hypothetical protein DFP72DRAFT_991360 [Ephemerocybe angulata]|uniref:Uncharacterized protein n=1 Tax=Ephemerocybe angulata TaxID=980116 RepID=A0A8H6HQE6_9AGAR|nr:hypothetical protein DFP72DRAFT_991360 [Tulosesus angulatus]
MDAAKLPHSAGGSWMGRRGGDGMKTWQLNDLLRNEGFTLVHFNTVIIDKEERMVAALIDKPADDGWPAVVEEAARCLHAVRVTGNASGAFHTEDASTRRGNFLQVPVGVSFGGGQKRPGNLYYHIRARRLIAQSILRNRAIQRISGVQSSAFAFLNPKLFQRYTQVINSLFESQPNLVRNFSNSTFPAASFNCGPASVSFDHHDFNNLSFGPCALTPLGNFDYKLGGHLILFELKLVLEFPPGTTVLLPSAALRHGNTAIQPGEDRMSIAQYGAGGLFRWSAYGFCSGKSLDETAAGHAYRLSVDGGPGETLYSTPNSLVSDHAEVSG